MVPVATYDALVAYARGLKPGDILDIGAKDIAPIMVTELGDLSLATKVTVSTVTVDDTPMQVTVTGTGDFFGLTSLQATLTFTPQDAVTGPFYLAIATAPPGGTQWQLLPDFVMTDMALDFAPNKAVALYDATMKTDIAIGSSGSLVLPVAVTIPTYPGGDWAISGKFDSRPLTADAFSFLTNKMELQTFLPESLAKLREFGLTAAELGFDPVTPALSYVTMTVAYTERWSVLNIIDVPANGVTLKFMLDFKDIWQNYIELEAKFEIGTVPVDIGAHFAPDDFFIWGRLQAGKTVNITDLFAHFHVTLPKAFPNIDVTTLAVGANLSLQSYSFDIAVDVGINPQLKLKDLAASVKVKTIPSTKVEADFHGTLVLNETTTLFLGATYAGDGSGLTLKGTATNVPIGSLITYLWTEFGIPETDIPEPIRTLELVSLTTSYNTASGDFFFECTGKFIIYDTRVDVMFHVDIIHSASPAALALPADAVTGTKGYSATFGGKITFAQHTFDAWFNTTDTGKQIFVADYHHSGAGGDVRLHDLVASVSDSLAAFVPTDISVNLKVVKFAYLKAPPKTGGPAVNHFLFGLELGAEIGLTDLPLIGDKLPHDLTVSFEQLQVAYAMPGFDAEQAAQVNALWPKGVAPIPADGMEQGILVSSLLRLGAISQHVAMSIPVGKTAHARQSDSTNALATLAAPATSPAAALSINIQKTFGPVSIRKLGLSYENNHLFVTGDLSLNADILAIGLIGLGIGSRLDSFEPAVKLSGLTITIEQGSFGVTGGLYGSFEPLNFSGALQVTMPSMTIGALGGYAQLGNDPSFFMYASLNRPLIGYPFFFLDGLAGGIGFNRDLLIPDIDNVATFPLVEWATGSKPPGANPDGDISKQIDRVITALATDIPPRVGEFWVAAGINFSSFNVLKTFALATVAFGTEFKIALLGLTTASLPPDTGAGIDPIGYVEMALRASFAFNTGILQVEAKLTPASYILTSDCKLTGGFAYYMWSKDNPDGDPKGYHAGDFVVSLGGYNPAYQVPDYFPNMPRLGFNWKVDKHTTIKGGMYFAMTPSALMAGGALEAVWQSGDLKAWFTAHADFLLAWKPFHYETTIGLSIGASYKLNLLFTSSTISVHLGVELSLWGPPFGGTIYVDLTVISFTVDIGNQTKPAVGPIAWTEFKTSFLPQPGAIHASGMIAGASVLTDSYCLSQVAAGLIKDLSTVKSSPDAPDWIVSAEGFELVTMTALPAKTASLTTAGSKTTALPTGATGFGVGPVDVAPAHFASTHAITLNKLVNGKPDPHFDLTDNATIELAKSNLPAATWSGKVVINPSISQINNQPANISDLAIGYRIKAKLRAPDHTPLPIDIAILQKENEGTVAFAWRAPKVPTTDDFDQSDAMCRFQCSLTSASAVRKGIIAALNAPGLDLGIDPNVDVTALADSADTVLLAAPVLSYLGEIRQGS